MSNSKVQPTILPITFEDIQSRIQKSQDDENTDDKEALERARKKAVNKEVKELKDCIKQVQSVLKQTETVYEDDIYSKDFLDKKWMNDNEKIQKIFKNYPNLPKLLTWLHERTQGSKGLSHKKMQELSDKKHKSDTGKKWDMSLFIVNDVFYKKVMKELTCSRPYANKLMTSLCKIGILKKIVRKNRQWIYSDGYFIKIPNNRIKKISYLISSKECIKGLEDFSAIWGNR